MVFFQLFKFLFQKVNYWPRDWIARIGCPVDMREVNNNNSTHKMPVLALVRLTSQLFGLRDLPPLPGTPMRPIRVQQPILYPTVSGILPRRGFRLCYLENRATTFGRARQSWDQTNLPKCVLFYAVA